MTSPFKIFFLVQHFGSFGSNQYDHDHILAFCRADACLMPVFNSGNELSSAGHSYTSFLWLYLFQGRLYFDEPKTGPPMAL